MVRGDGSVTVVMRKTLKTPLAKAVVVQMRVLATLSHRWWIENGNEESGCAGCWTRHGVLVIVAHGNRADRIAGELKDAWLLEPQVDQKGVIETEDAA